MTLFQLLMLGASAFFAYKIYEHIQTLQDPQEPHNTDKKSDNFDGSGLIQEGDAKMEEGDYQKALAIYSEANYKEPKNPETLFKIAYTLMQQNRDEEALEYLKEAVELDKNDTFIHQALASVYRKLGEYASARNHLNVSLALDSNNPITYYNYGNLLVDMKHFEEAKEMYKKALELDNDFQEAQEELRKLQEQQG